MWTRILTAFLLPPCGPLLLLLLGYVLARTGRRRLGTTLGAFGFLLLWGLSTPVGAAGLARTLEDDVLAGAPEAGDPADAIVVLGGGLGPAAPPRRSADLTGAADRVLYAARLFRAGRAPLVIAVGGYPKWMGAVQPEGEATRALLVEWGVPEERIRIDTASLDTHENAQAVAGLLATRGASPRILLVTSALHMARALAAFRAVGLEVRPAATDFQVVRKPSQTILDWIPSSDALDLSRRALHEWVGRGWYALRGWSG